ncbi:MAG: hypothetical protein QGH15_10985 [Kiritimatiellia bacterium]|jgi:hypothetical protein|nr:hypothetical protein [Kiritimatiellia bacterium]
MTTGRVATRKLSSGVLARWFAIPLLLLSLVLLAGCASPQMKGTPFYSGEYKVRQGPVEDRVNIWPLLYFRDPALSVLWPLMELTEDHFALRPLCSVYGLDGDDRVVNVLWPIARFDTDAGENRIFPVYWGKNYAFVLPLYWHQRKPQVDGVSDMLVPLWSYSKDRSGYNTHVMWPVFNVKDRPEEKGGRVWPLGGSYSRGQNSYSFALWPLGHRWSGPDETGSAVLPLYAHMKGPDESVFFSLPYSCSESQNGDYWRLVPPLFYNAKGENGSILLTPLYSSGESSDGKRKWSLLLPVYFASADGDRKVRASLLGFSSQEGSNMGWMLFPLLSGGKKGKDGGEAWMLGPVAHASWGDQKGQHHVFPFYLKSEKPEGSMFLSLPWSSSERASGESWQFSPLVYFKTKDSDGETLLTPLYARGSSASKESDWQTVLPLYYRRTDPDGELFTTLLGGVRKGPDGKRWMIYPLLSWGNRKDENREFWAFAPMVHAKWDAETSSHHVLPLYYWNGEKETLVSPLLSKWEGKSGKKNTLIPPALTMVSSDEDTKEIWSAAGLVHLGWGEDIRSQHVLPIFYNNRETGTFVSPVAARWRTDEGREVSVVPPALSWLIGGEKRKDLWMGGGLAHLSWGEERGAQHVFPVFYENPNTGTMVTPLIAKWKDENKDYTVFPPLLSGYWEDGTTFSIAALLGLFQNRTNRKSGKSSGHMLPFYLYDEDEVFYTPLFGWNKDKRDGFFYPLTPLAGVRTGERYSGGWLFPFYSHRRDKKTGSRKDTFLWGGYSSDGKTSRCQMFPLFGYRNMGDIDKADRDVTGFSQHGKRFWCLPACWYQNTLNSFGKGALKEGTVHMRIKKHGFFPLWSHKSRRNEDGAEEFVSGSVLLKLFDYEREVLPPAPGEELNEYTRKRILWRIWHYEKSNDEVSVDTFPFITYDSRPDGFKKVSFIWRMFRYEKNKDGRNLDLLFIPLMRTKDSDKSND